MGKRPVKDDISKLVEMINNMHVNMHVDDKEARKKELEPFASEIVRTFESINWIDETFAGDWVSFRFLDGTHQVWIRIGVCTPEFAERIKLKDRFPPGTELFTSVGATDPALIIGIHGWDTPSNVAVLEELWRHCEKVKRGGDGTQWDMVKWITGR